MSERRSKYVHEFRFPREVLRDLIAQSYKDGKRASTEDRNSGVIAELSEDYAERILYEICSDLPSGGEG